MVRKDVVYATAVDGSPLKLDLYHPSTNRAPLIVWVHGGAWRSGSKNGVPILRLVDRGYAIASVDYRLTPAAAFPAQVLDIRKAVRHLQENADEYDINAGRVALVGASAGGHLAALVGVSQGVRFDESDASQLDDGAVKAIVSFYGASNLETILSQSTPHGLSVRVPALRLLLGGQPEELPQMARLASPVYHVDRNDPPLLLIHGDQDPQMPINQSHELEGCYQSFGLTVQFEVIHGAGHGGKEFYTDEALGRVDQFLMQHLR